jgi:hypothetical protein
MHSVKGYIVLCFQTAKFTKPINFLCVNAAYLEDGGIISMKLHGVACHKTAEPIFILISNSRSSYEI